MKLEYRGPAPTQPQIDYVRGMQGKLKITDAALDLYCKAVWTRPFGELSRHEVSYLIDDMRGWKDVPPALRKAMGQLDLFGGAA